MKNSIYLLMMFLGLALTSCEPMEDIHEELDTRLDNQAIEGIAEYTLTADDYADLDLDFGNFSSLDDAASLIPGLLTDKFPVWGEGSLAQITFDLYAPIELEAYTVAEEDYAIVGLDVNYFTKTSQIKEFLATKYSQAKTNEYVELTYKTVAVGVEYKLTGEDFSLVSDAFEATYPDPAWSAGNYENFERRETNDNYWSNEMILEAVNVVMKENFEGVEGQTYEITYDIYDGSSGTESMKVRFDGSSYVVFGAENFEMVYDDYSIVATAIGDKYPGPTANATQYGSFTVVEGDSNYWSQDMILEAINVVLKDYFPTANEGDKFNFTYKVYLGGGKTDFVTESVSLNIGEYVWDDSVTISTIIETQVYAHGDGSWMIPLALPENIYTEEFDQQYNNLGSEADAGFYIGRWLEPRFPYAQEGDFVSVAYDYYDDGVVTRYASFIYDEDNREWEFIPSVIDQTLQFGHEGSGWVVDNTIVHTLAPADYIFIGEQLSDVYTDPAWSVGNYNNFDRRPGNANQWTDAMLYEAFNILLNQSVAPDAAEGQKYLMTFDIYNGTNTVEQMHLIKADGVWVPVQ